MTDAPPRGVMVMMSDSATAAERQFHRLEALTELRQWGTPAEERFDRITRLAREMFGVPQAEINFLDGMHQFTKSPQTHGQSTMVPLTESLCATAIQQPDLLVVPDATQDDRFSSMGVVQGRRHIRFYAATPLTVNGGTRVGTLCLVDTAPRFFTDDERVLLTRMGSWVERELRDILEKDRAVTVQRSMFPLNRLEQVDFDVAGLCIPVGELSGDFYDWYGDGDVLTFTLADVMGKGAGAALTAASIRSAFRARAGQAPEEAFRGVSDQLMGELEVSESFATVFHGRLDRRTGQLDYVDAGHGLSIVIRSNGEIENPVATGLPLGIPSLIAVPGCSIQLHPGDAFLSATDGLLDLFEDSIDPISVLSTFAVPGGSAEETIHRIRDAVASGHVADDVTVLIVARHGSTRYDVSHHETGQHDTDRRRTVKESS